MRSNVARPSTHHLLLGCALVVALAAATPTALQAQLIKFTQCNFTATLGTPLDMVMVYDFSVLALFVLMGNFVARSGISHDLYEAFRGRQVQR